MPLAKLTKCYNTVDGERARLAIKKQRVRGVNEPA